METILKDKIVRSVAMMLAIFLGLLSISQAIGIYSTVVSTKRERDTITISAQGKVESKPDLATVDMSVISDAKKTQDAEKKNTTISNKLIEELKKLGIAQDDIKTSNYQIYPIYDYNSGVGIKGSTAPSDSTLPERSISQPQIIGYTVRHTLTVKIRKIDAVGNVLKTAAGLGVSEISSVLFSIDDPDALKQQARVKAFENAKAKAQTLADAGGVRLGKIVSFKEEETSLPPWIYGREVESDKSVGGAVAPTIEPGTQDVIITVIVVFEIK